MADALNFCPKAIADLLSYPCPEAPGTRAGNLYVARKLREAQVFQLPDCGQLLDRAKPRPEVPGLLLKPAFPVMALEYTAQRAAWEQGAYTAVPCPKRIALAWEWQDDLPDELRPWHRPDLKPGVVVAAIFLNGNTGKWLLGSIAAHIAYDAEWQHREDQSAFRDSAIESGRISRAIVKHKTIPLSMVTLSPETITLGLQHYGSAEVVIDHLQADMMDEVNAYVDLCVALACKNVSTEIHPAPERLNRQRVKAGKMPLRDFHVLKIAGGATLPGSGSADGREGPRSHLRRGHIRRLSVIACCPSGVGD